MIVKTRKLLTTLNNEKGTSAVEFALVLPVLILFILGIIQFGFIFFHWLSITHAAREGARWASLENPDGTVTQQGTTRYKVWQATSSLNPRLANSDIAIAVLNPDGTVRENPADPTIEDAGNPVTVTVTYDSPIIAPLMKNIFGTSGNSITLVSSATQKIE